MYRLHVPNSKTACSSGKGANTGWKYVICPSKSPLSLTSNSMDVCKNQTDVCMEEWFRVCNIVNTVADWMDMLKLTIVSDTWNDKYFNKQEEITLEAWWWTMTRLSCEKIKTFIKKDFYFHVIIHTSQAEGKLIIRGKMQSTTM